MPFHFGARIYVDMPCGNLNVNKFHLTRFTFRWKFIEFSIIRWECIHSLYLEGKRVPGAWIILIQKILELFGLVYTVSLLSVSMNDIPCITICRTICQFAVVY